MKFRFIIIVLLIILGGIIFIGIRLNIESIVRNQSDLNLEAFKSCYYQMDSVACISNDKKINICGSNLFVQSKLNDIFVIDLETNHVIFSHDDELKESVDKILQYDSNKAKEYKAFIKLIKKKQDGEFTLETNSGTYWINWVIVNDGNKSYSAIQKIDPDTIFQKFNYSYFMIAIGLIVYFIYGSIIIFSEKKLSRRKTDKIRI